MRSKALLRVLLGVGIAINGAVLVDAGHRFASTEDTTDAASVLATSSNDERLVNTMTDRCGAPYAKLYERCAAGQASSMRSIADIGNAMRRSWLHHALLAGANLALLAWALIALSRSHRPPTA